MAGLAESAGTSVNNTTSSSPAHISLSTALSSFTSPSGSVGASDALYQAHFAEGGMLVSMMVGGTLLLSMAIASTVILARRLHALSMPPPTSPLMMTPRPAPTPRLRMPTLRIPSLRVPAFKLRMPALLRMPTRLRALRLPAFKLRVSTWRKRGHDSEASWTIGAPSTHDVLNVRLWHKTCLVRAVTDRYAVV